MTKKHSIWGEIEGNDNEGYYVEGWSRLAGWFCMELEDWNKVVDELRMLGFSDTAIFKARHER